LSFFDEGDEPRRAPRPRRPATATRSAADQQTLRVRQGVAAGVILLVVILLVVGIRGCINSQKQRSLRDYNRNVADLIRESDSQVGAPFFQTLGGATGGTTPSGTNNTNELQSQINQLRIAADALVTRARRLDAPGDVGKAQTFLVTVFELRRDAIAKIAAKLPTARAQSGADTAVNQIAGQMEVFVASDVLYSQRVIPYIKRALDNNGIHGQTIATSRFLPDLGWLDPTTVASRIGATLKKANQGPAAPGSHGHALTSVSVNGTELQQNAGNKLPGGSNVVFSVKFANQGENDETNVVVKVTIEGANPPITVTKTVPKTAAGTDSSVDVPLGQTPPSGKPVTIKVDVEPVPGEGDTSNNSASYPALFG
jgi:hypothetical protein